MQDESKPNPPAAPAKPTAAVGRWMGRAIRFVLVLAVLGAGAKAGHYWLTNRPKPKRTPPQRKATLVSTVAAQRGSQPVVIRAMGTVVPARTIQLTARVAGEIKTVQSEFVPGGRFADGVEILQIEPKDYELAVQQRTSDLARANSDLKLEMGQQSVSRREYQLLGREVKEADEELLLRKPQLATARAAVASAQAALDKAVLDRDRAKVTAPFNAMIQSRSVNKGSQVAMGTQLASLVGTDEYWVQVSVPLDELKWITVPPAGGAGGSPVRVYCEAAWGKGVHRAGTVSRLMTELEPQGRMARLLVSVKDPLQLAEQLTVRHPLILGSYVRVEITGAPVDHVVRVPRTALRDGGRVWVLGEDSKLEIRPVTFAWSGTDCVYVRDGLAHQEQLIVSDLATPVQGMPLRLAQPTTAPASPKAPARRLAGQPGGDKEAQQ